MSQLPGKPDAPAERCAHPNRIVDGVCDLTREEHNYLESLPGGMKHTFTPAQEAERCAHVHEGRVCGLLPAAHDRFEMGHWHPFTPALPVLQSLVCGECGNPPGYICDRHFLDDECVPAQPAQERKFDFRERGPNDKNKEPCAVCITTMHCGDCICCPDERAQPAEPSGAGEPDDDALIADLQRMASKCGCNRRPSGNFFDEPCDPCDDCLTLEAACYALLEGNTSSASRYRDALAKMSDEELSEVCQAAFRTTLASPGEDYLRAFGFGLLALLEQKAGT